MRAWLFFPQDMFCMQIYEHVDSMLCRYKKSLGMSIVFNSVSTAYGQTKDLSYINFS